MIDGFVALAFGFCAAIEEDGGQEVVAFGYVSAEECHVRIYLGDSHGETLTINQHEIGVKILGEGAEIGIDDLRFVIPKTAKA